MADWSFYDYTPSKVGAIIALLCFGASAGYHVFQLFKLKSFYFTTFIVGAMMMTLGYLFRAVSSGNSTALGPYVAQNVCILLPPSLYAATIYMIYGRIVLFAGASYLSIISPQIVTKIFVTGDVIAFLTQASGGGMMAISSMAKAGQMITIFGLFVQLVFFGGFLTISVIFGKRLKKVKGSLLRLQHGTLLYVLFGVSILIIIRCIYRVVEFCQGNDGYLMGHEAFLYVFDTIPMFVVQAIFHYYHPGQMLVTGDYQGVDMDLA